MGKEVFCFRRKGNQNITSVLKNITHNKFKVFKKIEQIVRKCINTTGEYFKRD